MHMGTLAHATLHDQLGHLVVDVGDAVVVAEVLRHPQRDVEHPLRVLKVAFLGGLFNAGVTTKR